LQKTTINFIMSVLLYVHPSALKGSTGGIFMNFIVITVHQ